MKDSLNEISQNIKKSKGFYSIDSNLNLTNELLETCKDFLSGFDVDYSKALIKKVSTNDGVFLIRFSLNGEAYVGKTFFEEVIGSKNTEEIVLKSANGKLKTGKYPTEELVSSNDDSIVVYDENAISLDEFSIEEINTIIPNVLISQAAFHQINRVPLKGSFLDLFEGMAKLNEDPEIYKDYSDSAKSLIGSCYEKLKGSSKVLCLGSYELRNYKIQKTPEYKHRAVKFFNCWYCVKDYEALDYAMMIEFACGEGAERKNLYEALRYLQGDQVADLVESIQSEVSELAALTYFLFSKSESRDKAMYEQLFVDKVRLSDDPKKFKKMVENMAG